MFRSFCLAYYDSPQNKLLFIMWLLKLIEYNIPRMFITCEWKLVKLLLVKVRQLLLALNQNRQQLLTNLLVLVE